MKIKYLAPLILLAGSALLSGCSSTPSNTVSLADVIISEPLEINFRKELYIKRLNDILMSPQISVDQRAQFLYERGVTYDSLGLKSLASFDFNQAVSLKPDLAEAYNFIGVYLTLSHSFDRAYEAFDSANDLDPNYQFTFLSRGIALYYGDRAQLANQDMQRYLAFAPTDPYRILWQYIIQAKYDKAAAMTALKEHAKFSPAETWSTNVVKLYLGQISEYDLLQTINQREINKLELSQRLCEAYFYLGKYRSLNGDEAGADDFYRLALSTNVYDFIEHKYARLELDRQ